MNLKTLAFALVLSVAGPSMKAADGRTYEFIKTNSGKVYTNCRVFKTDPDGVIIAHQNGGAKLLFSDLAPDARAMLGYDEKKEADYVKGRADAAAKEREQMWNYRKEVAKAQASAYAAEARRMEIINLQMGGAVAYGGGLGYGGWDGTYGYHQGHPFGYQMPYGRFQNGYLGYYGSLYRGRTTLPTPGRDCGVPGLNVIGRNVFVPQVRSQATPLGVPAMGAPTPSLGAGGR